MAADDLVAHAIVTLHQARQWIEGAGAAATGDDDILIKRAINAVTQRIEDYLNRHVITRGTWITEYTDGHGEREYFVNNPPILDLDTIWLENIVTLDSTDCADTDQVRFDSATGENSERGQIYLIDYRIAKGYADNAYFKYKGGWYKKDASVADATHIPEIPRNIFMACLIEVKRTYKMRERQDSNVASKSLGVTGESVTYVKDADLSDEVMLKIDKYRREKVCY
jgi:hypothetical protein